jgi:hypothetical protein
VIADETTADAILADDRGRSDTSRRSRITRTTSPTTRCAGFSLHVGFANRRARGFGAQYDPTMTQGLWLADQIYDDFTIANDSAWYWWTALSPVIGCDPKTDPSCVTRVNTKGFNDGLLYYDEKFAVDGVTDIFPTKRFYVLGQFSRYVRPGAIRHDVRGAPDGASVMAFEQPTGWTVVAWNEARSQTTFGIALPTPASRVAVAVATSADTHLSPATVPARTDTGAWLAHIAPQTIVTYTFSK